MYVFNAKEYLCLIEMTFDLIGQKWKSIILGNLSFAPMRYNQLRRSIPNITQKVLTQQLKELENCHLVSRRDYSQKVLMVEYSLTELGQRLIPAMAPLHEWGKAFIEKHGTSIDPMYTPPDFSLRNQTVPGN
jgi:DNA-binding HxlR family transcriptional regulator